MKNFWKKLKKPFFVLAPMSDVTDFVFRRIVADCGRPDVFFTEFVSADGLFSAGRKRLIKDLAINKKSDHPIVAQFFGSKPVNIYKCAQLAVKMGFDGIDINMGCPDRKVLKQGAGSALIKTPNLAKELILSAKDGTQGKIPVSVKTRIGYFKDETDTWLANMIDARPDAVIIHGRTMKEMSKVPAHWDVIAKWAKACRKAGIICVGNGDIMDRQTGVEKAKKYGLDGIMVGRGIFQNPWIFNKEVGPENITPEKRLEILVKHTRAFVKKWDGIKNFDVMKKFFKIYVSGWPGAKDLRAKLMATKNLNEVMILLKL